MKAIKYFLTIVWLVIASQAQADDFSIVDFSIDSGETKTFSIALNNTQNSYIAFEFYLTLPEGVTIPEDEYGYLMAELNGTRVNHHVLEVSLMPNGSYHFLCYSNRNSLFKGTSGEIILLTVTAAENIVSGNKQGKMFAQKLCDPNETKVTFNDFTFQVNINGITPQATCPHGCLLGDMNQDGMLSITDVMLLIDAIIGK